MDEKRKNAINLSMLTGCQQEDLGLGTAYERWSLARLLQKLYFIYDFSSVLEGPADGMSGIKGLNSLSLAKLNCNVSLNLPSSNQIEIARNIFKANKLNATFSTTENFELNYPQSSFDLVWNFCIAHILETKELIDEMVRISRKYVMIIVPNPMNYGFLLHLLDHMITGEPWNHGKISRMNIKKIATGLEKRGLEIMQIFLVDVPFWPDIDKPLERVGGDFLPFLKNYLNEKARKRYETCCYKSDNLPYFSNDPIFEERMYKLSFIERNFPDFIKIFFAHHHGVIAKKK